MNRFDEAVAQAEATSTARLPEPIEGSAVRRELQICAAPPRPHVQTVSIEEGRQIIREATRKYKLTPDPDYILHIGGDPGMGKTWSATELAQWCADAGMKVFYLGPRHDFWPDVIKSVKTQDGNVKQWMHWWPRQLGDDEKGEPHTCKWPVEINEWIKRGQNGIDFCMQICHSDYYNNECPYAAQAKKNPPIVYGQHWHLVNGHPMAQDFDIVIVDEDPKGIFPCETTIPPEHIHVAMPAKEALAPYLYRLSELAHKGIVAHGPELLTLLLAGNQDPSQLRGQDVPAPEQKLQQGLRDKETPPQILDPRAAAQLLLDVIEDFDWQVMEDHDKFVPTIRKPEDVNEVHYHYLAQFLPILKQELDQYNAGKTDYISRIYLQGKQGLTFITRNHINPALPKHIVYLDATANPAFCEVAFERKVRTIQPPVEWAGTIYQVTNRSNHKGRLLQKQQQPDGTFKQTVIEDSAEELDMQIQTITQYYENPAIITYQALRDRYENDMHAGHFYANRGSNAYEENDAIIIAGTPMVNPADILKDAKAFWPEEMEPFDDRWAVCQTPYNYISPEGHGYQYPASQFMDERLNLLLWNAREAELIQATHRARILFREVDAWLLTNLPVDRLPPTKLLTLQELLNAPSEINVFEWKKAEILALEIEAERGLVTVKDIQDGLGIRKTKAHKYFDHLIATGRWHKVEGIKQYRKGRPPKMIQSQKENP